MAPASARNDCRNATWSLVFAVEILATIGLDDEFDIRVPAVPGWTAPHVAYRLPFFSYSRGEGKKAPLLERLPYPCAATSALKGELRPERDAEVMVCPSVKVHEVTRFHPKTYCALMQVEADTRIEDAIRVAVCEIRHLGREGAN